MGEWGVEGYIDEFAGCVLLSAGGEGVVAGEVYGVCGIEEVGVCGAEG